MAISQSIQQSFGGGVITPALQSREDLAKQHVAVLTGLNCIVTSIGSIKNRGGFRFIAWVEDSTKQHRLLSFVFSREQAYGTVWGDENLRFIKDGVIIESSGSPVELVTPYSAEDNDTIYNAQSADVMYLVNSGVAPYKLTRTSDIAWTLTKIAFKDGPWMAFEDGDDEVTITPNAKTGAGVGLVATDAVAFAGTVIGDQIRLGYENPLDISQIDWGWGTITATPSATARVVTIEKDLGFEYLLNPKFENDTAFWEDRSVGSAYISHDSANKRLVLNMVGSDNAHVTQEVTIPKYEKMTLEVVVDLVNTQIRVRVGNSYSVADVLAEQIITTPGTYSYTTKVSQPVGSTVFVYIDTGGAPNDSVHAISRISLMRAGLGTYHHRKSAWSASRGWPRTVTLSEQAAFYGGNHIDEPDTTWKTRIGDYENLGFNSPPVDSDAVTFTINSDQVDDIEWIAQHGELLIGTSSKEWRVTPGPATSTITPTSISAKPKSKRGSANVKPVAVGDSLLFLGRNSNKVYAVTYSLDADALKPVDVTVLAPHLLDGYTITEWAYQATPDSVVWCVRSDGAMLSLSYVEEQDLWAWCLHTTDGKFESLCVVPESGVDTLYVIVKRTIDGDIKRSVEMLEPRINDEDIYDWRFLDSATSVNNPLTITGIDKAAEATVDSTAHGLSDDDHVRLANIEGMVELNGVEVRVSDKTANDFKIRSATFPYAYIDTSGSGFTAYEEGGEARLMVSTITDLDHLEDKQVAVLADGSVERHTVAGNEITLNNTASLAHVGLGYNTDIKTLPHDFVAANGVTSQGKTKKLSKVNIYFNKTRSAEVGSSEDSTLYPISFNIQDQGDAPAPLFTGIKEKLIESTYKKLEHTFIRNSNPVPIEVVGIVSEVDYGKK